MLLDRSSNWNGSFQPKGTTHDDGPDLASLNSASYAVTIILSIITFYATVTQTVYCAWTRRNSPQRLQHADITSAAAAFITLLRVSFPFPYVISQCNYGKECVNWSSWYKIQMLELSLAMSWMTIWFRQRMFYREPLIQERTGKVLQVLSNAIPFVIFGGILLDTIFIVIVDVALVDLANAVWIILYIVSLTAEVALLLLLLYPIVSFTSNADTGSDQPYANHASTIKSVIVISVMCILIQLTGTLVKSLVPLGRSGHQTVYVITNDLVATSHMFAVLASFPRFVEKMAPWRLPKIREKARTEASRCSRSTDTLA